MERLTDKNRNAINRCGEYSSCYSCHRAKCYINELCDKLGELEDVLEKYGIESAEELDKIIHRNTTNALIENENKSMLELQNEQLKHQLAVKDKAVELACKFNIPDDEHSHITLRFADTGVQVESWQELKAYALEQAEKELKE